MDKKKGFLSLLFFLILLIHGSGGNQGDSSRIDAPSNEQEDRKEFLAFCELGFMIRENPEGLADEDCAVSEAGEFDKDEDLPMLFTLILMCTWGAFVRALAKKFEISIPYTVLLLISGAIIGGFSHKVSWCPIISRYTAIARISPHFILYTFLPILIFESAFSISVHTFYRSFAQIFILAFPGMLMASIGTAYICYIFFSDYEWTFIHSCLFGCIVSATDPVAVVSILKDLGVSEQLGVLIDGESLMNDGVAILLFELFHHYATEYSPDESVTDKIIFIIKKFIQISVGGPLWGWFLGRVVIFALSYVYNDAAVEISVTICAAYLTYWSSEYALGVSGVLAVVVLGVTMSNERTVISPESEGPVHHFWEMLGYLANTILFALVGIGITETAYTHFEFSDVQYLFLLYITLHIVRLLMLLMYYPILRRLGYGLDWESLIVIMWGGLRGAVGICLALQIYEDKKLCHLTKLGPKILFHTAGIVLLTLCINGTTTKALLQTLRLTEVTVGQKEEMNNAVRRIRKTKWKMIRSFQMCPHMIDAHYGKVDNLCEITNPYDIKDTFDVNREALTLKPPRPIRDNTTVCWHCGNVVENEPTVAEYRELTNDARLRAIKSMKIHYLHLFEKGTLTEQATQLLLADAETAEDKYLTVIQAQNFHKHMKAHGFYRWLRDKVILNFNLHKEEHLPEPPSQEWRYYCWYVVTRDWFDVLTFLVVCFNTITVVWDFYLIYGSTYSQNSCKWTSQERSIKKAFYVSNNIFAAYYTMEFILKIIGHKFKDYIRNPWHYLDFIVLIVVYVDIGFAIIADDEEGCKKGIISNNVKEYLSLLRGLRLFQFIRSLRLLRPIVPRLLRRIRRRLNFQIFIGYDMGKGFVETSDAVIKFIPQITENKKVQQVLRAAMKRERNACSKDLAVIHTKFPGVAVALKTRHTCRVVLNQMQLMLVEVKDDGLLDDMEYMMLKHILEEKMRRLTHSPTYIPPEKPLADFHGGDDNKSLAPSVISDGQKKEQEQ